ncbi:MAG: carboxypeptidase-like regulatory domain-containing protein, partial [Planctomycetota bacterium]
SFDLQLGIPESQDVRAFYLTVSAKGFKDYVTSLPRLQNVKVHDWGTFALDENKEYIIKVKDESGMPVPGAELEFYMNYPHQSFAMQSNEDGEIHITSQELKLGTLWSDISIRVQAPGMADHLICLRKVEQLPKTIVLKPSGFITTRVIDAVTGNTIPGAKVDFPAYHIQQRPDFLAHFSAESDAFGILKIPKFYGDCIENHPIEIMADHYQTRKFNFSADHIPDPTHLDPIAGYVRAQVIDKATNQPIPDLLVDLRSYTRCVTDSDGLFEIPSLKNSAIFFMINAEGYERCQGMYGDEPGMQLHDHRTNYKDLVAQGGVYRIELTPREGSKARIMVSVFNELGFPVAGAKVRIGYRIENGNVHGDTFTNLDGVIQNENFYLSPETEVFFDVSCGGYLPHHSSFVFSPNENWISKDVVLETGIRFDKIRIKDQDGDDYADAVVYAELTMRDGSIINLNEHADTEGLCSFNLPFFNQGEISACHVYSDSRPREKTKISFDDILQQKEIIVTAENEYKRNANIQGTVCDQNGIPMEWVEVHPMISIEGGEAFNNNLYLPPTFEKTDEHGYFKINLYKNLLYDLRIQYSNGTEFWCAKGDFSAIPAGSDLKITMEKKAVVEVDFSTFLKQCAIRHPPRFWLASEEGEAINSMTTYDHGTYILFQGVTPGKMRIAYETEKGKQSYSPFFDVEEGNYVKITLEAEK